MQSFVAVHQCVHQLAQLHIGLYRVCNKKLVFMHLALGHLKNANNQRKPAAIDDLTSFLTEEVEKNHHRNVSKGNSMI